jgi:hypothetical protein
MAGAIATIPHEVTLPPTVGSKASLNLFVAHVGESGGGKGIAEGVAAEGFPFCGITETYPIGAGEGIARTFRPHGTKDGEPNALAAAIFSAAEVDTLASIAGRTGSTVSAELRKLYSGEHLGFANSGKETRNIVQAHSYRACLSIGVQPSRSQVLLGAADGGLPQRFVWLPTTDPDADALNLDHLSDDELIGRTTAKIDSWEWTRPSWYRDLRNGHLQIPGAAIREILLHRNAVVRADSTVNPLDGHALLTQLKVAAALMAMEGRTVVNIEDWTLARDVMSVSRATREHCLQALASARRGVAKARALDAIEREDVTIATKHKRALDHIGRRLDKHGEQTRRDLESTMNIGIRDYLDAALAEMLDAKEIRLSPAMRGKRPVNTYTRVRPYTREKEASTSEDVACTEIHACTETGQSATKPKPTRRRRERNTARAAQQTGERTA